METESTMRTIKVFRYDPLTGGEGSFQTYTLDVPQPDFTTILDVLLRLQKEQDSTLAFRYACRVNMCGSCGLVINGREGLACKTNVGDIPAGRVITIRPLNHFPVIKDLVVDMDPFFSKYEDALPFFEPKDKSVTEPYIIRPDDQQRADIGMATDCIACGCCVSSCTMVNEHEAYCGPAALNRAFTLLADERDGLFEARLTRALDSCYHCRTEFNCTEVCPKNISGTRAIKYIQRLALKNIKSVKPLPPHPAEIAGQEQNAVPEGQQMPAETSAYSAQKTAVTATDRHDGQSCSRRQFIIGSTGLVGGGVFVALGGILGVTAVAPTLKDLPRQWIEVGRETDFPTGSITSVTLHYKRTRAFHSENVEVPVLVRRDSEDEFVCFSSVCTHLGCSVRWDPATNRFKCSCHGGAFDRDGNVVAGPPPSPLPRLSWRMEAGILKVEVV